MAASQPRLFGTNGVRFVPGVSHDLDFAISLAEAIGTYFGTGEVLLGRDGRLSGPALANAAASGLLSSGRDVAEAGLVPTPALQYAVKALGYRGGVMVTASHNPPQYNGLKVSGPDGVEVPRLDEQRIEKIYFEKSQTKADWKTIGVARQEASVVRTYQKGVLSRVDAKAIAARKFTVVMDLGNGAQSVAAPYIVESLGCKVITLNSTVDGNFPGRGPEPTPDTLKDLSAAVKAVGADLGVAYDGDGDRSIFCDEDGRILWGDQSGCLVADFVLDRHQGGTLVTSVASSQAVEAVAKKHGAKVLRTKVGAVEIARTIIERNAVFGFEENGGCLYQPHIAVRDGGMTTALMLECLARKGMSLSKVLSFVVPKYFQAKTKVEVGPKRVDAVMRAVEKQAEGEVEKVDGLKAWTDAHSWVLVRPSGTEPIVRIFAESDSQEGADQLVKRFAKVAKSASV
ncbi:MAG: phosphoglucosamine mutase [Nitrososphaerota archaeon]|nr:phosphoglucosamine mutase [Nitrososphaerota archaeon]MDG6953233.1 phosphoglucosamine mutase [Nitrososphaerota archaeon]MDG6976542.1 phosphoglucosamine mutase [Nitrososphaerota archaeon]